VTRLLRDNGFEATIIDLNLNTVRELWEQGMPGIYGDATHRDTLVQTGAAHADNLILTSAGMGDAHEVIRNAKELNRVDHRGLQATTAHHLLKGLARQDMFA
jgi:monovalent cation:H+ antiporter-2, CPA2 family